MQILYVTGHFLERAVVNGTDKGKDFENSYKSGVLASMEKFFDCHNITFYKQHSNA